MDRAPPRVLPAPAAADSQEQRRPKHGESHPFIDPSERPSAQACADLATSLASQAGTSAKDARWAEQLWLMVAVAASRGVRQGELLDMRAGQLKFSSSLLQVDRQLVRVSGQPARMSRNGPALGRASCPG